MVNITIDNNEMMVEEGTTILKAARSIGIFIPTLCFLEGINEIGACKVCVVEVKGEDRLVTSCNNIAEDGMVIYTNSRKVRRNRKNTVEMILSAHDTNCAVCTRSQNCELQNLSNDLDILEIPYEKNFEKNDWNDDFPLIRDASKCIKCMRCIQICDKVQGLNIWDLRRTGSMSTVGTTGNKLIEETDCSICGQCITHCPVGALRVRDDTEKVWRAIEDESKITIVQVAPAVRTAWGESLGLDRKEATIGKIVDSLRKMGFDHVFDTTFSADLTIMEEANEFLNRFTTGGLKEYPMFTSCCPGWVRFIKTQFPDMVDQLSTAKSPMQMFGSVMKSYYADKLGVDPSDITTVAIMPCVAKKDEAEMKLNFNDYDGNETDYVLTTRELVKMIKSAHINPKTLVNAECDELMHDGTGAGVIFGTTGGVMEAALRTAYKVLTGDNPEADAFEVIRRDEANESLVEANLDINGIKVRTAVVSGLGATRELIERIKSNKVAYDFVEVMACPGGCVGGGGQPIHDSEELAFTRGDNLYYLDENAEVRFSHDNKDIQKLYAEFFGEPNSHKAHELLHTDHDMNPLNVYSK